MSQSATSVSITIHRLSGSAGSPVAAGYTRVVRHELYTPERGYGWSRMAASAFDRTETLAYWCNFGHADKNRTDKQTPHWAPTNSLIRDGIQDPDEIEFRIDVPDGDYWVRVTCGDPYRSCFRLCWDINGTNVLHDLSTKTNWGGFVKCFQMLQLPPLLPLPPNRFVMTLPGN